PLVFVTVRKNFGLMNLRRPWRTLLLVVLLIGTFAESVFACHEASLAAETAHPEANSRTFLIDLYLDKSDRVRAVQVWTGNGPLRSRAVKAAATKRYRPQPGSNPAVKTVEVKFSRRTDWGPIIREVTLGVSSCIPAGAAVGSPLMPWVNQLLSSKPTLPFLVPVPDAHRWRTVFSQ